MWKEVENALEKTFEFKDFATTFSFMTKVADLAEEQNHHPWWSNVYNKVTIRLNTHDAGDKITSKDHMLAEAIDRLLS
jgi:4a-hydroxytetrahydrobiopterin dehydratase